MTNQASRAVLVEVLDRLPVDVDQDLSSVRALAESRVEGGLRTRQSQFGGRTPRGEYQPTRWRRIGVVAAALGIAVVSTLFALRAFNGPQTVASDIQPTTSSSPSEVSEPPVEGRSYLPPYLAGGNGWNSRSSGPVPATGQNGTGAWASTIPISEDDVRLRAAFPPTTITELPADGIVVTVEVVPSAFKDTSAPFPYADVSFDLTKATERGPQAEEPAGDYSVLQMNNGAAATLVRVYFGSPHPSPELIAKAQAELDTLQLPPTCTVGGPGSYAVSASVSEAQPGDTVTMSGSVPFQREDGSFDESGTGQMVAWWNVAPDDWERLLSGSPSPSPAIQGGDIVELGTAPMDECTFAIPFTVPDVAPGDYPTLVLQEGGGGATLEGSVVVHVSGR